ncbi:MAG: DUF2332 family protein [Acidimicrobiales bacterium]|nr:DUF2332 family protein [Acidimicrobiales bacterium]HRW37718.1 DUF2332 family protein [Aquihabitans sp.]
MTPDQRATLLDTIATQRLGCELAGSPLYAAILEVVAADVASDGPLGRLLAPVADAPFGDAVLLRLLGGLHRLVLEGRAPELARRYPSVAGADAVAVGGRGDRLGPVLISTVEDHAARLAADLRANVQTNEVGRSASLLGGYLEVARAGLPLRVLEVGASAGLNLRFDRYRYLDGPHAFGPADSPLRFVGPWAGAAPDLDVALEVVERAGCDVAPIDPADPAGALRLRSFVWADQLDRLARLDAALEVATTTPAPVTCSGAADWLDAVLAEPTPGRATVVSHSIVLQYLSPDERRRLLDRLDAAGDAASPEAPLAWLRLEPGGDQAELRLTTWPGGATRVLATSAYHGPPVVWRS